MQCGHCVIGESGLCSRSKNEDGQIRRHSCMFGKRGCLGKLPAFNPKVQSQRSTNVVGMLNRIACIVLPDRHIDFSGYTFGRLIGKGNLQRNALV